MKKESKDQKKKKRQNQLEAFIFSIMEKSMKEALNKAMDDLFKDFK